MATLTTLRPDGTGTLSLVNDEGGGTTNIHLKVDDDPDLPEVLDYIKNSNDTTGDKTAFLLMTATDADFATMTTLQVDAHIVNAVFVDDTCTLFARMYQSDETTALTDEVQVATQASVGLQSVAFTGVNTTADKATWDAARLRLRWAYARNMGADGGQQRVTAVELDGTYAAGVASESKSDSDSAAVSEAFTLTAAPSGSDSAAISEAAASITATATGVDSAAVTETADGFALAGADSATLADTGSSTATLTASDSAAVADTGSGSAVFADVDSATVTDNDGTVDETVGKAGSDSAAVSESIDVITAAIVSPDSAAVTETGAATATSANSDSAAVSEAGTAAVAAAGTDSAAVSESAVVIVSLVDTDSATATDIGSATVAIGTSDSATLNAETSSLTVSLAHADSATITEAFASIVATLTGLDSLTFADVGSAQEFIDKDASDSFTMTEGDATAEESVYVVNQTGRSYATVGASGGKGTPGSCGGTIAVDNDGRSGI